MSVHQQQLPVVAAVVGVPGVELACPVHIADQLLNATTYISIEECRTVAYLNSVSSQENKALLGLCLSIWHISMSTSIGDSGGRYLLTSSLPTRQATGPNSRARTGNATYSRNYDRLVMFADLRSSTGCCFACILEKQRDSTRFFDKMKNGQEGVGAIFVLEEPPPVKNTLGSTTSVATVEPCDRTLPVVGQYDQAVLLTPLTSPPAGETAYFAKHHVMNLMLGAASFQEAICAGKLCDRQVEKKAATWKCGCIFAAKHSAVPCVVEVNVGIDVPLSFDPSGSKVVHNFRSFCTSQLFLDEDCWPAISLGNPHQRTLLQNAVTNVVIHINTHGGWTYVRWVRTGAVQDTSDVGSRESENVASRDQMPHISYLYPTDPADIAETNVAYQACKVKLQDLVTAAALPLPQQP